MGKMPNASESAAYRWWGNLGPGSLVVLDLKITFKGSAVWVPLSAYYDLANPNTVQIAEKRSGCIVRIEGGDASEGYRAEIVVKRRKLSSRAVHLGEFPEALWERTIYVNIPITTN